MSIPSPAETTMEKAPILTPQSSTGSHTSYSSQESHAGSSNSRNKMNTESNSASSTARTISSFAPHDTSTAAGREAWEPLGFNTIPVAASARKSSRFANTFGPRAVSPLNNVSGASPGTSRGFRSSISAAFDEHARRGSLDPQQQPPAARSMSMGLAAGASWGSSSGRAAAAALREQSTTASASGAGVGLGLEQQQSPVIAPLPTTGPRGVVTTGIPSSTTCVTDDLISPLQLGAQPSQSWGSLDQITSNMLSMDSGLGFADPFATNAHQPQQQPQSQLQQQQQQQQQQSVQIPRRPTFQRTPTAGSNMSLAAASSASVPFSGSGSFSVFDEIISPRQSLRQRQPPAANRSLNNLGWALDNSLKEPLRQSSPLHSHPSPTAPLNSGFLAPSPAPDEVAAAGGYAGSSQLHRTVSRESASSSNAFAFPVPWNSVSPTQHRSQSFSVATLGRERASFLSGGSVNKGLERVWEDDVISNGYDRGAGDEPPANDAYLSPNKHSARYAGPGNLAGNDMQGSFAGLPQSGTRRASELSPSQLAVLSRSLGSVGTMQGIDDLLESPVPSQAQDNGLGTGWGNVQSQPRHFSEQHTSLEHLRRVGSPSYLEGDASLSVPRPSWADTSVGPGYVDRAGSYLQTPPISPRSPLGAGGQQYGGVRRSSYNHLATMFDPPSYENAGPARRHSAAALPTFVSPNASSQAFANTLPHYGHNDTAGFPMATTRNGFPLLSNPCESEDFHPHVHSQHPNGLAPVSRSMVPPCRADSPLFIVTFKCFRAGIYYVPDGSTIHAEIGDLVFVDADRGQDLGTVVAVNLDHTQARLCKEWYDRQHLSWLMLYSRFCHSGNAVQPFLQPDRPLSVAFAVSTSAAHLQGSGRRRDTGLRPKYMKRVWRAGAASGLRDKEALEAKAKRLCQERASARGMQMEILEAEYQWDSHKLTFFFYAEAYINFNDLVEDMFREYKTRIWMEAVNPAPFHSPSNYPLNNPQPYVYRPLLPIINTPECERYTAEINMLANDVANYQRQSLMHAAMMTHYPITPTAAEMNVPYLDPYHVYPVAGNRQLQAQQKQDAAHAHVPMRGPLTPLGSESDDLTSTFNTLSIR